MSTADDLAVLPPGVAAAANVDQNGEVWWRAEDAAKAVEVLADAGLVILGLDLRDYAEDGCFVEVSWSAFRPTGTNDVEQSRTAARDALARPDRLGDAVLITWERGRL